MVKKEVVNPISYNTSNLLMIKWKELFYDTTFQVIDWMKIKKDVEMRGIEPRAFHMQSERSTTELHPRRSPGTLFKIYFQS